MSLLFAAGSPETLLSGSDLRGALFGALESLGVRKRVLAIPPDYTRVHSQAGPLTCFVHEFYRDCLVDVLPALGTHLPMSGPQLEKMFPGLPSGLIRTHRWREDVVTIGHVPADFVRQSTENIYAKPWPVQLNRLIVEGEHDLILSIGQVVPHEVIGMANFNKNLFIGTGGPPESMKVILSQPHMAWNALWAARTPHCGGYLMRQRSNFANTFQLFMCLL